MPFKDSGPIKKKSIKFNNENSSVPAPKPSPVAVFEEQAKKANSRYEEYKQRTWELSSKFKAMIEDKILPELKSPLTKGIEIETITKLVALASDMNEDDNQPEGIGSTALSYMLMKMLLIQRDTINILQYKVDKLEKASFKLEQEVKVLASKKIE